MAVEDFFVMYIFQTWVTMFKKEFIAGKKQLTRQVKLYLDSFRQSRFYLEFACTGIKRINYHDRSERKLFFLVSNGNSFTSLMQAIASK